MSQLTIPKVLRHAGILFLWCLAYYATGVASLAFDDPSSKMAVIWFPAGISVSAFLISRRAHWPMLFVAFMIARILLDPHEWSRFPTTLLLSALALSGSVAIAWLVRRFARSGDELHAILVWLLSTVFICAIQALLRTGWMMLVGNTEQYSLLSHWMSAVNGVFFATIVVMNVLHSNLRQFPTSTWEKFAGGVGLILLAINTWYIFGAPPGWLAQIIGTDPGAAIYFILACLPIALTLAVCVAWRSPGGSIALLVLGSIVVSYTDQKIGPFYLPDLLEGEPLLLAQSYLSITALLVVCVRVMTQSARSYDLNSGRLPGDGVMYQLHPHTGEILWDENLESLLDVGATPLNTLQQVLERVHPEDREAFTRHWSLKTKPSNRMSSFAFRISNPNGDWLTIHDQSPGVMRDAQGQVIVGNWQISRYS